MSDTHPGSRIFILGAGFSKPAGLPLASELFSLIREYIESRYGTDTKFHRDLEEYITYRKDCDNVVVSDATIDLEEFMSYLDIEHFLSLRGKDTWSEEGNESQLMIRKAIGHVIHTRTPAGDKLPEVFYEFAHRLSTRDVVITFNYDVVLERALEHIGKPYRLFPLRFKDIGKTSNIIDSEIDEVVILKLHGSVDWFSDNHYKKIREVLGSTSRSVNKVFDDPTRYDSRPIVDGPRSPDDPLLNVFRVHDADRYYEEDNSISAPFILSPSHVKFIYAAPLLSFWHGLGTAGGYNLGISVIGFSLPVHDEYIRVGLYQMVSNYQQSWWDEKMLNVLKDNVKLVDFRITEEEIRSYKTRFAFVDADRAQYYFGGMNSEAVSFCFDAGRAS